jgi:hypothetical protein
MAKITKDNTKEINNLTTTVGSGAFTASITGLLPNTTYYARAYAINAIGTSYGDNVNFKTISEGGAFLLNFI